MSASVAACGGGGDDDSSSGVTTLTFIHPQAPDAFTELIAGFEKANPDIKIEEQIVPFDDLNSTVQSRLGSEDPSIDLYDVDEPRLAAFASRGFLLEVDDLRAEAEGKIDQNALDITTYDGTQFAMPRWTSTQLLFYNKELLEQADLEAPSSDPASPMTWEEIAAAGAEAQAAGAEWGLIFDQVDRYYQLQPLPESLGAGPGLTGEGLLEPDITNEGWVDAFSWYAAIFEDGLAPRGIAAEQTPPLFAAGDVAYFVGGPWNRAVFDESPDIDYGVAPFPVFEGGTPASSTDSWSTGISPFSENPEEAKLFLSYMTIDDQGAWESSANNLPVQQDAFQRYLVELRDVGEREAQLADIVEYELANNAVSRPVTTAYVDFETVMNKAFSDIRNGSDPAERLAEASEELDRLLEKYR